MATTAPQIPVDEYLHTVYEPDCDFVDGELEERAVGERDHAKWQSALVMFFGMKRKQWGIEVFAELRTQVSARRYRVPDVCLLSRSAPIEQIVTHPPLAVFEILSPEDRMKRILGRLTDFDRMGVGAIWVIDPQAAPEQPTFYRYASGQLSPASLFILPGSEHQAPMAEIAALID